ncbi:MAG: F0F1 ATP synthase subunit B [Elusimicrobia bacterium]|nr:F0F1 ATP synthase subunit B [Elusimicrobiota bacterium]
MDKLIVPDTGLMFWTIVTFLCLVFILKKAAWGPLLHAIEEREGRIKADREGAEKARSEAERIQKEFEAHMAGAQAKAKEMLAAALKDGEALRAKLKAEAESDAQAIKDKTTADLAAEKNRLVGELRKEVASLSVLAAEKLMRKTVDAGVQKTVLDGFFKDLESTKAGQN